jgi:hypothetical protein
MVSLRLKKKENKEPIGKNIDNYNKLILMSQ